MRCLRSQSESRLKEESTLAVPQQEGTVVVEERRACKMLVAKRSRKASDRLAVLEGCRHLST